MDEPHRILAATPSMLRAHRANVPILDMGPTPERAAKAEIRPPAIDQETRRDAHEVLDVFEKYGSRRNWDALKDYVMARISEETASVAASGYGPRVDGGGWRSYGGVEGLQTSFMNRAPVLPTCADGLIRKCGPQLMP